MVGEEGSLLPQPLRGVLLGDWGGGEICKARLDIGYSLQFYSLIEYSFKHALYMQLASGDCRERF